MFDYKTTAKTLGSILALAALSLSPAAYADSGFFLGANVGNATVSAEIPDPFFGNDINFDEDDFAWKIYGGYAFDLPLIDFGVELGYFDLGGPTMDVAGENLEIGVSGISAFGLAGVNLGQKNSSKKMAKYSGVKSLKK